MIQRKQTLWLILATLSAILSFRFPFVTGNEAVIESNVLIAVDAGSNLFLLLLTAASAILSLVTIFMFKDRKLQMRLCILGVLVSSGILALYVSEYIRIVKPVPALWSVLPFIVFLSYIMAYRGIRHDEKLVKSLDKLR